MTDVKEQTKVISAKAYSVLEEWLNSITHGIGFVAAIVGLVFMLYRAEDTLALTTAAIYGYTLILVFLSSTLYANTFIFRLRSAYQTKASCM